MYAYVRGQWVKWGLSFENVLQVISKSKLWFKELFFKESYIHLCGLTLSNPYIAPSGTEWLFITRYCCLKIHTINTWLLACKGKLWSVLYYTPGSTMLKGGILVSPCPSVSFHLSIPLSFCLSAHLWTESCPLCIFYNTRQIHFKFLKFVTLTLSCFDMGSNMNWSIVWVIMGWWGYPLVVLVKAYQATAYGWLSHPSQR